jgi:hypothetical protein
VRLALEDEGENARVIAEWVARWEPRATAAIAALEPVFGDDFTEVVERAAACGRRHREAAGL